MSTTLSGGRSEPTGFSLEPVPFGEVDQFLERQRRQDEGSGGALMRASVSNLVVVCHDRAASRQALAAVERLGQQAPSRCVVLIAEPPAGREEVRTWARVVQRQADAGSKVVWDDEVVVQTTVPPKHLVAVVLPLLLPELPVFTWWNGTPPFDGEVFHELTEVSNRLIVDSAAFTGPAADLAHLARVAAGIPPAVSDCAWGRLTPWREMLAAPFGGPPLRGAHDRIRSVSVHAVEPTAGMELVGWFASRLGWELDEVRLDADPASDAWHARWTTASGACDTVVTTSLGAGALTKVAVQVERDDGPASIQVAAPPGHLVATVTATSHEPTRRRVGLFSAADPIGLSAELQVFGRDRIFEGALAAAAPLAEATSD